MSDKRFIKLVFSDEADYLIKNHPNAFALLYLIAKRVSYGATATNGLQAGQAHIGDYEACGLTRKQYRTALLLLIKRGHVKVIETCRSRSERATERATDFTRENQSNVTTERATESENGQKSAKIGATERATVGTLISLLSSSIFEMDFESEGHRKGHELDLKRDKEEKKKSKKKKKAIAFDRSLSQFVGITEDDRLTWQKVYPKLNLDQELLAMRTWLLSEKGQNRQGCRLFIDGWLKRSSGYHHINEVEIVDSELSEEEIDPFLKRIVSERNYEQFKPTFLYGTKL